MPRANRDHEVVAVASGVRSGFLLPIQEDSMLAAKTYEGEFAPRHCSQCDADDVDICCTGATNDDGSADDYAACRSCCGPHARFDPQVTYYPIG